MVVVDIGDGDYIDVILFEKGVQQLIPRLPAPINPSRIFSFADVPAEAGPAFTLKMHSRRPSFPPSQRNGDRDRFGRHGRPPFFAHLRGIIHCGYRSIRAERSTGLIVSRCTTGSQRSRAGIVRPCGVEALVLIGTMQLVGHSRWVRARFAKGGGGGRSPSRNAAKSYSPGREPQVSGSQRGYRALRGEGFRGSESREAGVIDGFEDCTAKWLPSSASSCHLRRASCNLRNGAPIVCNLRFPDTYFVCSTVFASTKMVVCCN